MLAIKNVVRRKDIHRVILDTDRKGQRFLSALQGIATNTAN